MRFLITGASGWVGFALTNQLAKVYGKKNLQLILSKNSSHEKESRRRSILFNKGYDTVICDLFKDEIDIKKIKPFDVLYHLAAYTEVEAKSSKVHVNDIGTEKLLKSLKDFLPKKRVIYTGSITSIDRKFPSNKPLDENAKCSPRTKYGKTKLKGEQILKKYANNIGFEWVILRLPTVYGPGFRPGGMFNVIPKSLSENSLAVRLNWPGRLSIVYLDDTVKALIFLSTKKCRCNEIYHIDSGENPTFDEIIDKISKIRVISRKKINLPKFAWNLIKFIVWFPGLMHILPHKIKISVWRASLIVIDGLVFDSSKLNNMLHFKYTQLEKALPATYKPKE